MNKQDRIRLKALTKEFQKGFEALKDVKKGVVIFGSARTRPNNEYYQKAEELSYKLAKKGFSIITGAGKGIMEAANLGAKLAEGVSIGLNIELPKFQDKNKCITKYIKFKHFYTRKVMFCKYSIASVVFPGGYGTLDEIFDLLAILQNEKIKKRPLFLVGKEYYEGLTNWLINKVTKEGNIDLKDLNLFHVTDDMNEVVKYIEKHYNKTQKFFI